MPVARVFDKCEGADNASKGIDNANKGIDNANKGTDNAKKGTDSPNNYAPATVVFPHAAALNSRSCPQ
jgi:hypothetical protein